MDPYRSFNRGDYSNTDVQNGLRNAGDIGALPQREMGMAAPADLSALSYGGGGYGGPAPPGAPTLLGTSALMGRGPPQFLQQEEDPEGRVIDSYTQAPKFIGERVVDVKKEQIYGEKSYITVEKMVEVPQVIVKEKIVQVPRPEVVERVIEVPKTEYREEIVEVPERREIETVREVPQIIYEDKIVHVPQIEVQERIIEVPKVEFKEVIEYEDRVEYREVPVDTVVEVPEIEYRVKEVQVEVPQPYYQEVPIEKVVDVPVVQIQEVERIEEVPVIQYRQVPRYRQVPVPMYRQVYDTPEGMQQPAPQPAIQQGPIKISEEVVPAGDAFMQERRTVTPGRSEQTFTGPASVQGFQGGTMMPGMPPQQLMGTMQPPQGTSMQMMGATMAPPMEGGGFVGGTMMPPQGTSMQMGGTMAPPGMLGGTMAPPTMPMPGPGPTMGSVQFGTMQPGGGPPPGSMQFGTMQPGAPQLGATMAP